METAHARAATLGFRLIVLDVVPKYHRRFGYRPLDRYPIGLPSDAPAANRMILPHHPHALERVSGVVEYEPGWPTH